MSESRDRIKRTAEAAAERMRRHHAGEPLAAVEIVGAITAIGNEVAASWEAYHASLAACPITDSPEQLTALYGAHAKAVRLLFVATYGEPKRDDSDPFDHMTPTPETPTELQQ